MSKILVTSGNIGTAAAKALLEKGHEVVMMVRKPVKESSTTTSGLTYRIADASRPDTLTAAFAGIERFLFVSPLVPNMVALADNLIGAAKKAGVRHMVRSSANGASLNAPIVMGKLHGEVEELVIKSGIGYTMLRPAGFFQNILANAPTIQKQNTFYGSSGEGKNALVDVRDIAEMAVMSLTGDDQKGQIYTVTGSQAISNYDIAEELSKQKGREISYSDIPPAELAKMYATYGMDQWTTEALLELEHIMKLGYVANISAEVEKVTGKPPITLSAFLQDFSYML